MGEQKSPKNSHLVIFMRALMTDGVSVCQVKAYHTELATTCPCMALIEIHDSETHSALDIATEIMTHNNIHALPDKSCNPQRVRRMLKAGFNYSLPTAFELLWKKI